MVEYVNFPELNYLLQLTQNNSILQGRILWTKTHVQETECLIAFSQKTHEHHRSRLPTRVGEAVIKESPIITTITISKDWGGKILQDHHLNGFAMYTKWTPTVKTMEDCPDTWLPMFHPRGDSTAHWKCYHAGAQACHQGTSMNFSRSISARFKTICFTRLSQWGSKKTLAEALHNINCMLNS